MQCTRCLWPLPSDARFCTQCGAPQPSRCDVCGAELAPAASFCGQCGEAHGDRRRPEAASAARGTVGPGSGPPSDRGSQPGERRQLTVMFCDVVNSTPLAERLDPEELSTVMHAYYDACAREIELLAGHIARYLGDGLLVYFGYPRAHEDDAVRAVRAGLRIMDAMAPLNRSLRDRVPALGGDAIQVRIGIHTGLVVVGGGGDGGEQNVLGNTLHVAARLQSVAAAGSVLISAATQRLVRGLFVLEDLGPRQLRGIAEPVPVFRAVQASGFRRRLQRDRAAAAPPLVGRESELRVLLERWGRAQRGHGEVVLIDGEAGIGKSRLVQAVGERLGDQAYSWLEFGGSPYHESSALFPVTDLLEQGLGFARGDTPDAKIAKLERGLRTVGLPLDDLVPLLAQLLSLPLPAHYAPPTLSADAQRRKTLEALARWIFALAELQPLVIVVEDLHWLDPSTLELLGLLIARIAAAPILLLCTCRPTFESPWTARLLTLELHPLTHRQSSEMIRRIAARRPLDPLLLEQVVSKTDGVPLFIEELTKAVLEAEAPAATNGSAAPSPRSIGALAIPSTLQDLLTARLDRLGDIKDVAMLAAVLGREFSFELLAAVCPLETRSLEQALGRLVAAELLYQRGVPPRATYVFKHSLIQNAAYELSLKSWRQEVHARIAHTLEERFPVRADHEPELIARHYEEAGRLPEAVAAYRRAGDRATRRSANAEAIRHLMKAIELLRVLPDGPERNQQELVLQVMLGAPMQAVKGFGDRAVEQAYGRARALCREIGDAPQLVQALFGLTAYYQTRGDLEVAYDLGRQLLAIAERTSDRSLLLLGHMTVGNPLFWLGRHDEALAHLDRTIALYDPTEHRALAYVVGQEPGVIARTFAALALWHIGEHGAALRRSEEAVHLARESAHQLSLAFALGFAGTLHWLRREGDRVRACAEELTALSIEQNFPLWLGVAMVQHGWALFDAQRTDDAVDELHRGLAQLAGTGARVGAAQIMAMLADVHRAQGSLDEAAGVIDTALAQTATGTGAFFDAELHRLRGEIIVLKTDGGSDEAERCFRCARDIAQRQNARSLQLRVAVSLARLLRRQRRTAEAGALLSAAYASFHDGFDTADLKEAGALLAELA